ncbi:MAG: thiamine-phosphate kinase, partial [Trebonia sp.]
LGHVAAASGVQINLKRAALAPGAALGEAAAAVSSATLALEWVLTGGEDHSLVAAFPPGTALPVRWRVIGEVRADTGVTVDGARRDGPGGWQHFR